MGMLTDNQKDTLVALRAAGFDDNDIPALMGNIAVETGNSFSHTQKQKGGGGGYGLFQFTGSHKDDYFNWIKKSNSLKRDRLGCFSYIEYVYGLRSPLQYLTPTQCLS